MTEPVFVRNPEPVLYQCQCFFDVSTPDANLSLRREFVLPFVPYPGLKFRFAADDRWLTIQTVVWDIPAEVFLLFLRGESVGTPAARMIPALQAEGWQLEFGSARHATPDPA